MATQEKIDASEQRPVSNRRSKHHDDFIEKFEHMELGYGEDRHDAAVKAGIKQQVEAEGVHEHVRCLEVYTYNLPY